MPARDGIADESGLGSVARGAALLAGLGGVLGGAAGTVIWPVVGTFFGAGEGAVVGAVAGVLDAAALMLVGRRTRSRWAARGTSGLVAGAGAAAAVAAVAAPDGPVGRPGMVAAALIAAALIAAAAVCGGAFGPLIAHGMEPAAGGPLATRQLQRLASLILAGGAALGTAVGGICGLVIGLRAYPPTAPFATVEGAVLGVVSGAALACLAVGVAVLPRVRARR